MKAKFFLLGLCALALAACSIDEVSQVNDTNAISFKATATRATAVTTNDINAFTVWAWEKVGNSPIEFMNGVEAVRVSEGGSTFTTAHTYYWPGAALDFYAFIPAADDEATGESYDAYFGGVITPSNEVIEGTGTYSYNGYVANATITSPDAISFDVHVPTAAAEEIDLGYAATLGQTAGTVGLNFRHALSQVAFKAMNGNADWTVDIKGVTLCGIYKEGTYTLPEFDENGTTAHNSTTAAKGTWTVGEVQGRFDAGIAETVLDATSQSITASDGALMLIPQTVAPWDPDTDPTNTEVGAYIRINCQVIDETGEQIWPNYHELDSDNARLEYADITVPFDVAWKEGNLYTYTIVFGEGLGYYAPDDENTDLHGTPVLIPIRFTVDIDDFGNTDEVDVSTDTGGDEDDDDAPTSPDALALVYTTTGESTEIALPILDLSGVTIDWGDGSEAAEATEDFPSHTYSAAGKYTVSIEGSVGKINDYVETGTNVGYFIEGIECLTKVKQWGNMEYTSTFCAFRECVNLISVPDGPAPLSKATTIERMFSDCKSLTKVPEDIFIYATEATDASVMFVNDSSLVSAPTFEGLSSVKNLGNAFQNCVSLASIPENMFKGCSAATDISQLFNNCTSLTAIPGSIFDGCTGITSITGVFSDCTNLVTIPTNIFDSCRKVTACMNTFDGCSSVAGESPYTEIVVDEETVKVHLYERNSYSEEFSSFSLYMYMNCFRNSSFTDIDSIPSSWGGNGN